MKNLVVNCATCDARFVTEKTLQSYEQIRISCATMLTTPASRELMNQYNISMNCATVLSLDEDVQLVTVNGKGEIRPTDAVGGRSICWSTARLPSIPARRRCWSSMWA